MTQSEWSQYGQLVCELRDQDPKPTFAEIAELFNETYTRDRPFTADAVRIYMRRWINDGSISPEPGPSITGARLDDEELDEDEVWQRALAVQARLEARRSRQASNSISFKSGPVAIVNMADLHLGGAGVDYARIDRDISLILDTPNMYVISVGDLCDNFIIGRLRDIRFNGSPFLVTEEWVLVKRVLGKLAPRLIAGVAGNHDLWTNTLSGIDYLKEIHSQLNPGILYDKYELAFDLRVGDNTERMKVRHSWRGSSIYNPTHGIERASKFDKGAHFDIGVGAHTHASGLVREFNNGGKTGLAMLVGSYKIQDDYKDQLGMPDPNSAAPVTAIVHEDGAVLGTSDLGAACKYMQAIY